MVQPTTKFKILQLSTHLAATPFATQSSIDIVCFVVVLPPSRSQAVTKARKELGIKGFCAVNGVHASTSSWCTRALTTSVDGVQTEQEHTGCIDNSAAKSGAVCSVETGSDCSNMVCSSGNEKGTVEHTELLDDVEEGVNSLQSERETCRMTTMEHYMHYKNVVFDLLWSEVEGFPQSQMNGDCWDQFLGQKLHLMDFMYQETVGKSHQLWVHGDLKVEQERSKEHLFQIIVAQLSQELQIQYFLVQEGLCTDNGSGQMDLNDSCEQLAHDIGEQDLSNHASGSTEDVPRDMDRQQVSHGKGRSFYEEFAKEKKMKKVKGGETEKGQDPLAQQGIAGMLRGGMINRFAVLEEDEEQDKQDDYDEIHHEEVSPCHFESEAEECSDNTDNEQDSSFNTCSSGGRSFYAEYFAQRTAVRGGAGGSNAAKNKQLTEAIGALAEVVKNFDTTPEEPESIDQVIKMIGEVVAEWQRRTPTKGDMRKQLLKFHQILEKDAHQMANPKANRDDQVGKGPQQSFYENFVQRFHTANEEENANQWQTKGKKGKGKGKGGKDKGKNQHGSTLPRFDVMKILPSKALTTWQVLGRELELAKEPTGRAVIMDSIEKMAEYQALTKAHKLTTSVIMIAKVGDEDLTGLDNPVKMWLPYLSNLALVQAVVATTTGEKTTLKGIEPVKKDGKGAEDESKTVTLRMVVDLKLVKERKLREHYKEQPHTSLHHALGKSTCNEIKTHGWTVGDELITGYCSIRPENVEEILRLSGKAGLFSSRLRQDIQEPPPVCWIKKLEGETDVKYHERAMEKADECKVALTRRNGGGAYLGLLKEDEETRNRAWQLSGIPHTWGPSSVRTWLENNDWHVETIPKPPNGRFKTWAVQGYVKSEPLKKHFAYQIKCGSKDCNITIYRWQKQRKPTAEDKENDKQIKGSRWWSSEMNDPIEDVDEVSPTLGFTAEVAATVMDVDDDSKPADTQAGKRASGDTTKNGSPQKKKTKTASKIASPEAALQGGSQGPLGSLLLNLGGGGDCGWRSLAWSFATANKTTSEKAIDNIETLATSLRIKVVNFLKTNCSRWKESWCPDDKATVITEDGEPAADYETFLKVLDRPRRWLCGLGLTAAALQMKCNIIIWQFDGKASETHDSTKWRRAAIIKGCRGSDNGRSPIVALVLHRGHYFALRYPPLRKTWPREWLVSPEEAERSIPVTQEVEDTAGLTSMCRGGAGGLECMATPKEKKVANDIEDMLRSFSSRRTGSRRKNDSIEHMMRTCSSVDTTTKNSTKKVIKHGLKPLRTWTCPICQETLDVERWKRPTNVVTDHLSRRHTVIYNNAVAENKKINRRGAGMGMAGLVKHVSFQEMDKSKWDDEADFVCPYCEKALPWLGGKRGQSQKHGRGYLLRLSKKHHLRFDCKYRNEKKGITLRQYHSDFLAKFGQRFGTNTKWYMQSKYIQKAKERGHDPVVFIFPKRAAERRSKHQMICKTCRKGLSGGDAGNVQCKGVGSRKAFNPGRIFWAQVTLNRKKKEVMEKLGMTVTEIEKAYAAVNVFRAVCPSKRRLRAEQLKAERAEKNKQI